MRYSLMRCPTRGLCFQGLFVVEWHSCCDHVHEKRYVMVHQVGRVGTSLLRLARRTVWANTLLWGFPTLLVVLTLVLNPLVCIVHCYFITQAPATIAFAGQAISICHTPGDDATNAPAPLPPELLRELYTLAPALPAPPLDPVRLLLILWVVRVRLVPQNVTAPIPPPPRLLSSCFAAQGHTGVSGTGMRTCSLLG